MQAITMETATSASGVPLPPMMTIGPKTVARTNAGPIAAAAITSRSPKLKTRRTLRRSQQRVTVAVRCVDRDAQREPHDEADPGCRSQPRHDENTQHDAERCRDEDQRRAKRPRRGRLAQPQNQ